MIPQHTWVSKLFGYDLTVEYRLDKLNIAADALSRWDENATLLYALSLPAFEVFDALRTELIIDAFVVDLQAQIFAGSAPERWSEVDGLLLFKGHPYVPDDSPMWPQLLQDAHTTGHEGTQKTLHHFRMSFYNPHASRLVREFVRGYQVCQPNNSEHLHPTGLLQPLPVPSKV